MDDYATRMQNRREIDALRDELTSLAGHLNAGNYRFLKVLGEFDRRNGWVDNATHSCAHYLNWKLGIDVGAAREKVRVARALEALPKISAAMERGEISYSNVRAITRVACPATEENLLMIARHGTASHVEKMVRVFRRAKDAERMSRAAIQQVERSVSYSYDSDGSLILRARLPAEVGAMVMKALEAAMKEVPVEQVEESLKDDRFIVDPDTGKKKEHIGNTWRARRADALALIAESFLQHERTTDTGGDHTQVVVHVSAETLHDHSAGCCELEDGPSLAIETVRRLACDASLVALVEDENGEPLNVGRKTRTVSSALRRLLNARDKGCRFPGCSNTRHVDAHHIEHWANGGETKPSNLSSLCSFHHRKVHEGGMQVQMLDDGAVRFIRRDGTTIDGAITPLTGDWTQLLFDHARRDIRIDERTAATRWGGERCDYNQGLESMLFRMRSAQRPASDPPLWEQKARELFPRTPNAQ